MKKPAPEKFLEIRRSEQCIFPEFAQRKWLSDLFSLEACFRTGRGASILLALSSGCFSSKGIWQDLPV